MSRIPVREALQALNSARRELLDERWWTGGHFAVPPGGAGDVAEDAVAHHG